MKALNSNKFFLALFFLIFNNGLISQNVEVIKKSEILLDKSKEFHYLNSEIDTTNLTYISTYKAHIDGKKNLIANSFFEIKKLANKLGANSFRLIEHKTKEKEFNYFILEAYFTTDKHLLNNNDKLQKNVVYIFSEERETGEIHSLKVNNEKVEFNSGTFLIYEIKKDEKLKISKGGFTGATVTYPYKEGRIASFISISGFGVNNDLPQPGTIGMSFNTGRLNPVEKGLGFLLIKMLKPFN